MLTYIKLGVIVLLMLLFICSTNEYINIQHNLYARSSEKSNSKHKRHHNHQKTKKKSRKNKKSNKKNNNSSEKSKNKSKQKGKKKAMTNYRKLAVKNNSIGTLSINTNIVRSTQSITSSDLKKSQQNKLITLTDSKLSSKTKLSASQTIFIKLLPTAVRHDTVYMRLSFSTSTPINTVLPSRSTANKSPAVTPSANSGSEISNDNDAATTEEYKALPNAHKLALGLGIGFGCLAIIGLILLFIQHHKKKQKINHHNPTEIGNFFSEKPRYLTSSNDLSTRWRPNSFLGVVASVVAKLPASRSSGSVFNSGSDPSERTTSKNSLPLNPSSLRKTLINDAF